jgi:hypothetical protein
MRMKLVLALFAAAAVMAIAAPTASASGRAQGLEPTRITCDGLGTITVLVQQGDNANGAAQITDVRGHGIPVAATFTLTDLATSTVVATHVTTTGQEGHTNQTATHCSGVPFD